MMIIYFSDFGNVKTVEKLDCITSGMWIICQNDHFIEKDVQEDLTLNSAMILCQN